MQVTTIRSRSKTLPVPNPSRVPLQQGPQPRPRPDQTGDIQVIAIRRVAGECEPDLREPELPVEVGALKLGIAEVSPAQLGERGIVSGDGPSGAFQIHGCRLSACWIASCANSKKKSLPPGSN